MTYVSHTNAWNFVLNIHSVTDATCGNEIYWWSGRVSIQLRSQVMLFTPLRFAFAVVYLTPYCSVAILPPCIRLGVNNSRWNFSRVWSGVFATSKPTSSCADLLDSAAAPAPTDLTKEISLSMPNLRNFPVICDGALQKRLDSLKRFVGIFNLVVCRFRSLSLHLRLRFTWNKKPWTGLQRAEKSRTFDAICWSCTCACWFLACYWLVRE